MLLEGLSRQERLERGCTQPVPDRFRDLPGDLIWRSERRVCQLVLQKVATYPAQGEEVLFLPGIASKQDLQNRRCSRTGCGVYGLVEG